MLHKDLSIRGEGEGRANPLKLFSEKRKLGMNFAWQQFLPLKQGIPKHDVFRRVFIRLIPEQIEQCFMAWVADLHVPIGRQVFAVDGKTGGA
jgi:hypothetical protein